MFTRLAYSVLALLTAVGLLLPTTSASAADVSTPLPYRLSIQGANGQAEVRVPVPDGTVPLRLLGELTTSYTVPGVIILTVAGRPAAEFNPLVGGPVAVDLRPEDIVDGAIPMRMSIRLADQDECFADDNAVATLDKARVVYEAPATPPTSIGAFLSPGVDSYTVAVSPAADDAAQTAALNAVGALTQRYSPPSDVRLVVTEAPPSGSFDNRVVLINGTFPGPGVRNTLVVEGFTLTITGEGESLTGAALALSDPNTDVLESTAVTNLTGTTQYRPLTGPTPLSDLGATGVSVAGVGRNSATVSMNQPAFGYQVASMELDLQGVVTALPDGGQGRVDFLWNEQLLTSRAMSAVTRLQQSLTIPAEQLQRDNTLTIQLNYVPPGGECYPPGLGARVDIDSELSTVTATPGTSVAPGFDRFPQAFAENVPIVFGEATSATASLQQAGSLVASLQSVSPQQYRFNVTTEAGVAEDQAAIYVGQTAESAAELRAPLTGANGTVDVADPSLNAQLPEDFASLQAFEESGREFILLSVNSVGTADQGSADALAVELARYTNTAPERWRALSGQVVALPAGGTAIDLALTQPAPPDKSRTMLLAALIGVGVVVLLVLLWLWRRPRGEAPPQPGRQEPGDTEASKAAAT